MAGRDRALHQKLKQIEQRFSRYRQKNPGKNRYYPDKLKKLVVHAMGGASTTKALAQAAKISTATVFCWHQEFQENSQARQLKVVPKRCAESPAEKLSPQGYALAQISLGPQLHIQLPTSEFSPELIKTLCNIAGVR